MRTPPPPEKSLCILYHAPSSRFSTLESAGFLWLWGGLGQLAAVHSTKWQRPPPQPFMQWLDIMNTTRLIILFYQWFLNVLFCNCFSWKCLVFLFFCCTCQLSPVMHSIAPPRPLPLAPPSPLRFPRARLAPPARSPMSDATLSAFLTLGVQQAADCVWLMLAQPVLKKIDTLSVQNLCVCYLRPRVASC